MSKLLVRNLSFLNAVVKASANEQVALISQATEDNIKALSEVALNILNGNLKISNDTKIHLEKHKSFLRKLSRSETNFEKLKKSVLKKKKVLKIFIAPLLSIIGSVLGKIISDNI